MQRSFCDPVTGEVKSRLGNVYFHLNLDCVRRKQPYFMVQMATICQAMSLNTLGQSIYIFFEVWDIGFR